MRRSRLLAISKMIARQMLLMKKVHTRQFTSLLLPKTLLIRLKVESQSATMRSLAFDEHRTSVEGWLYSIKVVAGNLKGGLAEIGFREELWGLDDWSISLLRHLEEVPDSLATSSEEADGVSAVYTCECFWELHNTTRRLRKTYLHDIANDLLKMLKTLKVQVERSDSSSDQKEALGKKWETRFSKMDEALSGIFSRTVETIKDDCERLITKKLGCAPVFRC
jgi:hypothetical protein